MREMNNIKLGFDCIGVSVTFFCYDGSGRFVMAQRGPNCRDEHHRWCIGSGGVELGEGIWDAVHREVLEEYGAPAKQITSLGFRDVHRDDGSHWVSFDFAVHVDGNAVINAEPEKLLDVGWFTFETMPANLHSQLQVFFTRYASLLKDYI